MPKVNRDQLATIRIPVPSKDQQIEAVAAYRDGCNLLDNLQNHAGRARKRIQAILRNVWEN